MDFEICIASLAALVQRPVLPHNLSRFIDTVIDPYLASFGGDKASERLRIAAELGDRAALAPSAHVEAVQAYLRR